jgi:hypothetical protein
MNKPTRTNAVNALISNLVYCLASLPNIKKDAEETNAALAFCELAVSIPPAWFTQDERLAVVTIIKDLYGDPIRFIGDLNDESVSFYNKMIDRMRQNGETKAVYLQDAVALMMEMHTKQYGRLEI